MPRKAIDARREYQREYRRKHAEKTKAYQAGYRATHQAERKAAHLAHYEKDRDKYLARSQKARVEKPVEIAAYQASYRDTHRGERRDYMKNYRSSAPAVVAAWKRSYHYGLSREEFDGLLAAQGNACAICERPFNESLTPCVDHCHASDVVRGILCQLCNSGIGMFRDDDRLLNRAITYLKAAADKSRSA